MTPVGRTTTVTLLGAALVLAICFAVVMLP